MARDGGEDGDFGEVDVFGDGGEEGEEGDLAPRGESFVGGFADSAGGAGDDGGAVPTPDT